MSESKLITPENREDFLKWLKEEMKYSDDLVTRAGVYLDSLGTDYSVTADNVIEEAMNSRRAAEREADAAISRMRCGIDIPNLPKQKGAP